MEKAEKTWLDKGVVYGLRVMLYCVLLFIYYYAVCAKLNVAVKYVMNCAVFAWAFLEFLLAPNPKKAVFMLKVTLLFLLPFLLIEMYSLAIWIYELRSVDYIIRGSENIIYMVTNMLMLAGSYYLFEEKCVDLSFYMALLANGVCFLLVARDYGPSTLMYQYFRQIVTFSAEGGAAIQKMELHDMTYAFGAYCVYYMMHKKDGHRQWIHIALCWLAYFCAMKRIGIMATMAGVMVGMFYSWLKPKWKKRFVRLMFFAFCGAGFAYVCIIKDRTFLDIVAKFGIETSGRSSIYYQYDSDYRISPLFFGNGIRYIFNYGRTNGGWGTIHNVYLELYIEIGFWMFFIWQWLELSFRPRHLAKWGGWEGITMLVAETAFVFITYFTDNTSFQPPINMVYRMASMVALIEVMASQGKIPWKRSLGKNELKARQRRWRLFGRGRQKEKRVEGSV